MNEELDNFLAHYGVKGMKWGVRRSRSSSLNKVGNQIKKIEEDANGSSSGERVLSTLMALTDPEEYAKFAAAGVIGGTSGRAFNSLYNKFSKKKMSEIEKEVKDGTRFTA